MNTFFNCLGKNGVSIPDALLSLQHTENSWKAEVKSLVKEINQLVSRYDVIKFKKLNTIGAIGKGSRNANLFAFYAVLMSKIQELTIKKATEDNISDRYALLRKKDLEKKLFHAHDMLTTVYELKKELENAKLDGDTLKSISAAEKAVKKAHKKMGLQLIM